VAWHRRAGKDDVSLHWTAIAAMKRVGTYWHMLPEASQARKAIWDAINPHTGKRRIDEAFPRGMREATRETDMLIRFKNGSTWQVVGSDNFNSLVGSPPVGVIFSEWSLAKPDAWTYLRPILAENGGWAVFIWTPRGRNHATRSFEARERDPEWFTERLPATRTGVFTPAQLAKERAELISSRARRTRATPSSAKSTWWTSTPRCPARTTARRSPRPRKRGGSGSFPYDPALPVQTAWDIGVDDYTAIWFLQENGRQVRAIDYYETSGEGPETIVPILEAKGYRYSQHHLPHDVMVREWGHGAKTRYQTLLELGIRPVRVGVAQDPAERINASRRLLPIVSFDSEACAVGLDRLRNYRKRWNPSLLAYTGPLHDENSHGADAFGEYAVNCAIVPPKPPTPPNEPPDYGHGKQHEEADDWQTA
jgi:phage terminase large subunit